MRLRLFATLLAALSTLSLFAAQPISLHPIAPTSVTPIEVHFQITCELLSESVQRTGSVIRIEVEIGGLCDPPFPFTHAVKLEPLPPGEYRIDVVQSGVEGVYATTRFVVRNGSDVPFAVHPFAVRQGVYGLRMWLGLSTSDSRSRS